MQIIENKALLLKMRNPERVTAVIPRAKQLNDHEVLVEWGLEEAQILKNMQVKNVPSPILAKYNWPGPHKAFAHQYTTASFLTLHRRAFCFNEQGTGKTASVIWAADYLMSIGAIKRVLVLCPLSIMQSAWEADLFTFAMHRSCAIAHSYSKEKRIKAVESEAEFVICNYDGVDIVKDALSKAKFDLVVVDECFVAGTSVRTPSGDTPIESLNAGDEVLTSSGVMRINTLVRNVAYSLVEVVLSNGKRIRCTPEHPFFTEVGWVCAKNLLGRRLVSDADVRNMRANLQSADFASSVVHGAREKLWADLHEILRTEEVASTSSRKESFSQSPSTSAGEAFWPQVPRTSRQAVSSTESERAQADSPWGERYWTDFIRIFDTTSIAPGVGLELPNSVGQEAARLSYKLQGGLRSSEPKDSSGGGRQQSQRSNQSRAGQKEGSETFGVWVESVSYIECPDGTPVYNLEVAGTPNYFVGDGYVVHNCNAYKNVSTKRWKSFNSLLRPDMWVWMLTGTPAAQSPEDAYGLAKIVNPQNVPKFFGAFRDQVMAKITKFKWIPKPTSAQTVHTALQPAIRFTKDECLDLPPMTYVTRDVPLTAQQAKYYEEIRKNMLTVAAGEEITTVNAAVNLNKLLQLSCGAVYSDSGEIVSFDAASRLETLLEVIEEASQKVIIFVPFRHAIDIIAEKLKANRIKCATIHGGISATARTDIFKRFQTTPDPEVLVIQPQAAAHGVTLHAANVVVWWGPITSIETYLQANARVHRAGQHHPCTVVHLQGSPVEKRIYKMLGQKLDIHTRLIDLYSNFIEEAI